MYAVVELGPRPDGLEALRAQVQAVHGSAHAWAVSCCRGEGGDAEEILQDAYAKVISGKARFDGRSSFKTWLFGVIRRTAQEHRRRGLMRVFGLGRLQRQRDRKTPVPRPDVLVDESDRARALVAALRRLPERQREVLHLVFYEGLSVSEAAAAMSVTVGSARTHYHRGKKTLRGLLEERGTS